MNGIIHPDGSEVFTGKAAQVAERETYGLYDAIIRYEEGELDEDETIALFQRLVDTGIVWTLQGSYGRTADRLIEAGLVDAR